MKLRHKYTITTVHMFEGHSTHFKVGLGLTPMILIYLSFFTHLPSKLKKEKEKKRYEQKMTLF